MSLAVEKLHPEVYSVIELGGQDAKIIVFKDDDETGRKKFKGLLLGLDGNDVTFEADGKRFKFPFRAIAEAKLVLTDKLIAEDLKARKAQ